MDSKTFVQSAPIAIPASHSDNDTSFSIASSPDTCASNFSRGSSICSLSTAATSVDDLSLGGKDDSFESSVFNDGALELHELDAALEKELQDNQMSSTVGAAVARTASPNPYQKWECGFGFTGRLDAPATIPETKAKFLDAINGEIATIGFVQNGLTSYLRAINSGEHHAFSDDFLKNQNDATHKTIGQLFQIVNDLRHVTQEVEALDFDQSQVKLECIEAFAHAQPWVQRTRAILVSAHVFYKINYVLGSDKKSHFG